MKAVRRFACAAAIAVLTLVAFRHSGAAAAEDVLTLVATIRLPNVHGRIDHMAFDPAMQRLFVAAIGNNTVEVVDTARNALVKSLAGFHEPQGVALVADQHAVAIANGDSGTLQLVDDATLQSRWAVEIGGDADNVRYDSAAKRLFVAYEGGIAVVDPAGAHVIARIRISGHPESFQFETNDNRLFANVPGTSSVIVADRASATQTMRWNPTNCGANYPMALDVASHRLFIGCRRPPSLAMFDTTNGKPVTSARVVGDTDDLFYDASRQLVFVIGGQGFVDILQRAGDSLHTIGHIATRDGARTGTWASVERRLYVAVPARRGESAEIRVFAAS